jgi:hypothetical protein
MKLIVKVTYNPHVTRCNERWTAEAVVRRASLTGFGPTEKKAIRHLKEAAQNLLADAQPFSKEVEIDV